MDMVWSIPGVRTAPYKENNTVVLALLAQTAWQNVKAGEYLKASHATKTRRKANSFKIQDTHCGRHDV